MNIWYLVKGTSVFKGLFGFKMGGTGSLKELLVEESQEELKKVWNMNCQLDEYDWGFGGCYTARKAVPVTVSRIQKAIYLFRRKLVTRIMVFKHFLMQ